MFIRKTVCNLLAGAVVGSFVAPGSLAAAAWVRGGDSGCSPNRLRATNWASGNGLVYNASSTPDLLYCSIEDTSTTPHGSATSAGVYGYNYSGTYSAWACVKYYAGTGGACSSAASTTATGNVSLSLALSPNLISWYSNPNDFAYLVVDMPVQNSHFYGYGITY